MPPENIPRSQVVHNPVMSANVTRTGSSNTTTIPTASPMQITYPAAPRFIVPTGDWCQKDEGPAACGIRFCGTDKPKNTYIKYFCSSQKSPDSCFEFYAHPVRPSLKDHSTTIPEHLTTFIEQIWPKLLPFMLWLGGLIIFAYSVCLIIDDCRRRRQISQTSQTSQTTVP